ncbi:MAG: DUF2149 domain-containing protein [Clostridiales Family XIII bacterium]|jgi:hypothetical protein|nr:DUF2149 domain-containing protein [Clostridiales Family XIII bacterium]
MIRRRFSQAPVFQEDDVNPMEGAINIVDAFLVFAVGLMLSLVIYWNVDLRTSAGMTPVSEGAAVSGDEMQGGENGQGGGTDEYEKIGQVYRDPATGKLYLMEDGADSGTEVGGISGSADQGAGSAGE